MKPVKSIREAARIPLGVLGVVLGALATASACASHSEEILGVERRGSDPALQLVDEAGPGGDCNGVDCEDAGLTQYCPATGCPAPYTTCPTSHFACDVNPLDDPMNCGACGLSCYEGASGNAIYSCIEGKCKLSCRPKTADCNGLPDDDCEVTFGSNANCTGCGDTCPDPDKPCIVDDQGKGKCGCDPGMTYCGECVDTKSSDQNCGSCGVTCDPSASDGGALPAHTYLGCVDSQCGHRKCDNGWADCDGNPDNGCEINLLSPTSCGSCTKVCDPGQTCRPYYAQQPTCVCPPGKELCGNVCVDTGWDQENCGGCGNDCTRATALTNGIGYCAYGSCRFDCVQGSGDCNGNPQDGCEVNLNSDPRNCGACGNACDILSGQPCIAGRCAVEPCVGGVGTR